MGLGCTHSLPRVLLEVACVLGVRMSCEHIGKEPLAAPVCTDVMVDVCAVIPFCVFSCARCRIRRICLIQTMGASRRSCRVCPDVEKSEIRVLDEHYELYL